MKATAVLAEILKWALAGGLGCFTLLAWAILFLTILYRDRSWGWTVLLILIAVNTTIMAYLELYRATKA